MNIIVTSTIFLGGLGFSFGGIITYFAYKFAVETDPRIEELIGALPGVNCGACGFAGCSNYAEKLAKGEAVSPGLCIAGGEVTAKNLAKIMDLNEGSYQIPKYAVLICGGGKKESKIDFEYDGVATCKAVNLVAEGNKSCKYGCLGFGDCTLVCPFNAIHIGSDGLPEINEKCTGCGKCIKECPKKVLTLVDKNHYVNILCHSNDKGIIVKNICSKGCIACMRCVKACPKNAINISENLASIDYSKCNNCGECIKVCPTNTILSNAKV